MWFWFKAWLDIFKYPVAAPDQAKAINYQISKLDISLI